MNYFPTVNVETRVHISPINALGQGGSKAAMCSPNFAAVAEANSKLKALELKALEQEKAKHVRRFVLSLISTVIFGVYMYSHHVSEKLADVSVFATA